MKAVEAEWSKLDSSAARSLEAARAAAPEKYRHYRMLAEEAATMVGERTGNPVSDANIEPTILRQAS